LYQYLAKDQDWNFSSESGSNVPGGRGDRNNGEIDMTKKDDDGFATRVLLTLITAVEDRNWDDVEIGVGALAKDHGLKLLPRLEAKMQRAFAEQNA
jgi:hypothetical protein